MSMRTRTKSTPLRAVHTSKVLRRRFIGKQPKKSRSFGDFFLATSSNAAQPLGGGQMQADAADQKHFDITGQYAAHRHA